MRRIDKKKAILVFISLALIAYLMWETYWYARVSLAFIKWHTHLLIYVYIGVLISLFYGIFDPGPPVWIKNVFLVLGSVLLTLFIAETILDISGIYKTDIEKTPNGSYTTPFVNIPYNKYHVWGSNESYWLEKQEFRYGRTANSLGFPDPEWKADKNPKVLKIMALGDSFTEGDGTPYDSSYVSLMRRIFSSRGDSVYIMNAGTCGSDPFFNFINLRDRLLIYKPDVVIQSIGSNDAYPDILIRGGMERFNKPSSVAPWWEPIYAISYVSRVFFTFAGYNQLLQKEHSLENEKGRINKSVEGLFKDYADLCRKNNIKLFVIFHPQLGEIEQNYYDYDFNPILNSMKTDTSIKVIDLLPSYRAYIDSTGTKAKDYFWVHDGHHNSRGYKMMAETTLQNIMPYLRDAISK